ncbi:MAG TPA: gliding motility-associated ABC transporter ATP-binding subunit GldA [Bacteroides sp.]|nr:gliding motility-associated ABC transporter ATP-binding subunit GldA [Bacteroides sp.]
MSIEVHQISKTYGSQLAVDQVSFRVHSGEIVGFIGPNGAGKSTTMKIITGTLQPDRGTVLIKDMQIKAHLKEIRNLIGYLPEHNPLYLEMYIREYLNYVAGLYRLTGSRAGKRIDEIIEMTGLGPEAHKMIGDLSKGYRQRVGLAQALVHDPEVLILDEPTSGLDPNQIVEIRNMISRISREKTVLLSTHILQEVEAICDRVLIIDRGRIVADERADLLRDKGTQLTQTIHIEVDRAMDPEIWKQLPHIEHVRILENNQFLLETHESRDIRADIFNFAVNQNLIILSFSLRKKSLEEVFREITKG